MGAYLNELLLVRKNAEKIFGKEALQAFIHGDKIEALIKGCQARGLGKELCIELETQFILSILLDENAFKKAREAIAAKDERALSQALLHGFQASGIPGDKSSPLVRDIFWKGLIQAARYDGRLQGTETGMVLFYTDLLMKLWALDFTNAAPGRSMASHSIQT